MVWDFSLNAENQKKYDEVTADIRKLQTEMGIKPMTLEERAVEYQKKKVEQAQLAAHIGIKRPLPKWKV